MSAGSSQLVPRAADMLGAIAGQRAEAWPKSRAIKHVAEECYENRDDAGYQQN